MKKFKIEDLESLREVFQDWGKKELPVELSASVSLSDIDVANWVAFQAFVVQNKLQVNLVIKCASPGCIGGNVPPAGPSTPARKKGLKAHKLPVAAKKVVSKS